MKWLKEIAITFLSGRLFAGDRNNRLRRIRGLMNTEKKKSSTRWLILSLCSERWTKWARRCSEEMKIPSCLTICSSKECWLQMTRATSQWSTMRLSRKELLTASNKLHCCMTSRRNLSTATTSASKTAEKRLKYGIKTNNEQLGSLSVMNLHMLFMMSLSCA